MKRDRIITLAVVIGGILALAIARRLGADADLIAEASGALLVIAGSLKSMLGHDVATTTVTIEKETPHDPS